MQDQEVIDDMARSVIRLEDEIKEYADSVEQQSLGMSELQGVLSGTIVGLVEDKRVLQARVDHLLYLIETCTNIDAAKIEDTMIKMGAKNDNTSH